MQQQIYFERVEPGTYDVLVNDVRVGRVARREQAGLNRVKDFRYSGHGQTGKARMVPLWEGTVTDAGLDEYDERAVERHITRPKTTREAAAQHLLDAYEQARVALPVVS